MTDKTPPPEMQEIVNVSIRALELARHNRHEFVTLEHMLIGLVQTDAVIEAMDKFEIDHGEISVRVTDYITSGAIKPMRVQREPTPSNFFDQTVTRAVATAKVNGRVPSVVDVLLSMLEVDPTDSFAVTILREKGLTREMLRGHLGIKGEKRQMASIGPDGMPTPANITNEESALEFLEQYSTNLNEAAKALRIDPLIGREHEVDQLVQITARRTKNNAVLVGEPGVGKTAIAEGLALKIVREEVPEILKGTTVISLDLGALVAGTRYRGEFEERLKNVIKSLEFITKPILFIDEIHMLLGAGAVSGGSMDASNMLKPALARGDLRCIGSTTHDEFQKHFEKDRALLRRFKKVAVEEPSVDDAKLILRGLATSYEEYHKVTFSPEALDAAVDLTSRYITNGFLPDKAIDIIDQAGARQNVIDDANRVVVIGVREIEKEVALVARIPEQNVSEGEGTKLKRLDEDLAASVFGQDKALSELSDAVFLSRAGLRESDKTAGAFLFAGPTGVGKTEAAKTVADVLGIPLLRYDMSEYMESNSVTKLLGSAPGFVGYDEGGRLILDIDKNPHAILLLDEIEKAHPMVLNTLLQVFDNATLTASNGKVVSFRNIITIMTSNVGVTDATRKSIGFGNKSVDQVDLLPAINKHFSPEFRNRLDAIVQFSSLNKNSMGSIVDKFLNELKTMTSERNVDLVVTDAAKEMLGDLGYDPSMGARPLKRVITEKVKKPLSRMMLTGSLVNGGRAVVDVVNDEINVTAEA